MTLNHMLLRRMSALSLMGSLLLGICLYYVKHQVTNLEKEIRITHRKSQSAQDSIHVLKAEWGFLNSPKRLQELNEQHIHLKPAKTYQIASLESLNSEKAPRLMMARLEKTK
ncbi:MAG: hypothetical protein WCG05_02525 [Alphaproteobacteria bacterium]